MLLLVCRGGVKPYDTRVATNLAPDHPAACGRPEDLPKGLRAVAGGAVGQNQPVRAQSIAISGHNPSNDVIQYCTNNTHFFSDLDSDPRPDSIL